MLLDHPGPFPSLTWSPESPRVLLRIAELCELLAVERYRAGRDSEGDALQGEAAARRYLAVAQ